MDELHQGSSAALTQLRQSKTQELGIQKLSNLCSLKAPFILRPLPYKADALEPIIDKETMTIHHDRHHKTYVDNLNKFLAEVSDQLKDADLENLFKNISQYPNSVRNNGGGHWNHSLFWEILHPENRGLLSGPLADAIDKAYGSKETFMEKFAAAAMTRFGSGWAWLSVDKSGKLVITKEANGSNPVRAGLKPLLGFDVWEHSYYLDYQNRRADHINALWSIVDWDVVGSRF